MPSNAAEEKKYPSAKHSILFSNPLAEILALDEALERLTAIDRRKVDLVEMRYFGGMTAEEIAECAASPHGSASTPFGAGLAA